MDRRRFLLTSLAGVVAGPLAGEAQPAGKVYRIGMLERTSTTINAANLNGFRQGLRELGYVEGKDFIIEYRSADGRDERYPGLVTELVGLKVDLILTRGTPATLAAKNASGTIPVVMTGIGDPVGQGIVASLARPGGKVTGMSPLVTELYPKRVDLLRELLPGARRLAILFNMGTRLLRLSGKRSSGRLDPWVSSPSLSTCERLRIWGRRSMAQSGSVPTRSSWALTLSHRRTSGSSLTWPPSIGWRRSMHPWSSSGA